MGEILDEGAILAFRDMVKKRLDELVSVEVLSGGFTYKATMGEGHPELAPRKKAFEDWLSLHGIKIFRHDWICFQFLDSNHVVVKVMDPFAPRRDPDFVPEMLLLVPKNLVEKSLVLGLP